MFFTPVYDRKASDDLAGKGGGTYDFAGTTNRILTKVDPPAAANPSQNEETCWHFCVNCHGLLRTKGDADVMDLGKCNHAHPGTTAHVIAPHRAVYILKSQKGSPGTAERATARAVQFWDLANS